MLSLILKTKCKIYSMAKNNVCIAADKQTRERLKKYVEKYNFLFRDEREEPLTMKDYIKYSLDYFERNRINPFSDCVVVKNVKQVSTETKVY